MSALEPRTRAEYVADELRRQIVSGELAPGARLRQIEIADRFRVSTTPVREAFTSLAREGLVRHDAHRGVVVFRPSLSDVRENYEIRMALEPLATELAAKQLTSDQLAHLDALLDEMSKPLSDARLAALNRDFHRTIYEGAERPTLLQLIERLRDAFDAYIPMLATTPDPGYFDAVRREHAEVVDALRAPAPKRAHKAMTAHLRHNFEQISKLLDR